MSKMQKVSSSNISEIGYNEAAKMLVIRFTSNKLYTYSSVSKAVYDQFMNAPSKGKFFGDIIKSAFPVGEIEEKDLQPVLGEPKQQKPRKKVDYMKALIQATRLKNSFPGAAAFF